MSISNLTTDQFAPNSNLKCKSISCIDMSADEHNCDSMNCQNMNCTSIITNTFQVNNPTYNFMECGSTGAQTLATQAVSLIVNWTVTNQLGDAIVKANDIDQADNAYDFIVQEDGIYSVECTMSYQAGGGQRGSIIYLQGGNKGHELDNNTGFENTRIQVSARDFMVAGDRIRIGAFQNSGGNLDVLSAGLNRLTIFKEQ